MELKLKPADWLKEHVKGIEARNYQLEAWEKLWQARASGRKRALIHLATGLGKTFVAAVDAHHYLKEENPTGNVLFVSHMTDISFQARATFRKVSPHTTGTFTTFQALFAKLTTIDPCRYDYIVWDEAHHSEAETFKAVRHHFKPQFELALTATPERADGRDILNYFGAAVYSKSLADGIAEGWLSAVDYHIVFDDAIKKAMGKNFEAKTLKDIRGLFAHRARNEQIAKEVLQRRHSIGLDKAKTIVFCQNIEAAEDIAKLLNGEVYHSEIPKDDRTAIMQRFKSGHLQVICTVDMFNEGIDIPDARLVVFLRSTSSRTIFEQQLGRGLRRHPGKDTVTVLDFVANVERINFVRGLGHTISRHRGSGNEYSGYNEGSGADRTPRQNPYFAISNFEFEDKALELLERYDAIKNTEYLTKEEVLAAYMELKNIAAVAKKFNVSWNAIRKHLRRAGITTYVLRGSATTDEAILAAYQELKSAKKTANFLQIDATTVSDRLKKLGITLPRIEKLYATPEMIAAYEQGMTLHEIAEQLGLSRWIVGNRLKNSGIAMRYHQTKIAQASK